MLYLNLALASLTLVCMAIVRLVHRMRPRWLSSVLPGMRWKFFFVCFGLAVVALIASITVGYFLPCDRQRDHRRAQRDDRSVDRDGIVILADHAAPGASARSTPSGAT